MKKLLLTITPLLIVFVAFGINSQKENTSTAIEYSISETLEQEYYKGFKDGWKEGWQDVKGKYSHAPAPPHPSAPGYPKSINSYKDGYNDGFKAGMKRAKQ